MGTIVIMSLCFYLSVSTELNQWNKTTGDNDEDIWYSTSVFVPVHSQSFGTIKIGRIMSIEFDFVFNGRTNDPFIDESEMFFRIGYDPDGGNGCEGHNSAYPALWLSQDSDMLFARGSDTVSCSNRYSLEEYGNISVGTLYHIFIGFNDTHFSAKISRDNHVDWSKQWTRNRTLESHLGDDVPIWFMSDKYGSDTYNRGNGTFSNMIIISRLYTYDTPMRTREPTPNPTLSPTLHPIADPTRVPILKPSDHLIAISVSAVVAVGVTMFMLVICICAESKNTSNSQHNLWLSDLAIPFMSKESTKETPSNPSRSKLRVRSLSQIEQDSSISSQCSNYTPSTYSTYNSTPGSGQSELANLQCSAIYHPRFDSRYPHHCIV